MRRSTLSERYIVVKTDNEWQKFSHKGFNSKRRKNNSSPMSLYLENSLCHYEPLNVGFNLGVPPPPPNKPYIYVCNYFLGI